ncbi:zinc ribbon domain-containing protein [Paenibacillus alginolyticus]|uniref:Zinc-ribbon domain-containing protein n=1 Tax=Paenibacillus alginolyticus TaxID=59839 RepID=A0ABT4G7B1_9BACL|nr:hypothetical protein [Paenibacillus alginolyticus]MCY9692063.1 hypothetical protein [Paenibacillus alginolyticus]MEC0144253.1 hypothetical protein [Paenibacillus alginolyticus]
MKFCKECGHALESGQTICKQCGTSVPVNPQPKNASSKPLIVLSRINKIILMSIASFLLLLFVGFKVGAALTSKETVLDKFQEALLAGDSKEVATYLHASDSRMKIDEKAVTSFIDYTKKNPSVVNQLVMDLKQQAKTDEPTKNSIKSLSSTKSGKDLLLNEAQPSLLTLKKSGKTLLFFDRYLLDVKPYFIRVTSNLDKTKVILNDTEIGIVDKAGAAQEFGPYMFGSYKLAGIYQGEYASLKQEQELQLFNPAQDKNNLSITFKTDYIAPRSNFEDARLFVNGKDVASIKDKTKLGPISLDGSVKLYAEKEFPWGKVKSKEISVTGTNFAELTISGVTDDLKTILMNTINEYNKSDIEAKSTRDASKYLHIYPERLSDYTRTIENMKSYNQYFQGSYLKSIFDLDSFQIYSDRNQYYALVSNHEFYNSTFYSSYDTNIQSKPNDVFWKYTLIYKDSKWYIYDHSRISKLDSANTKVFDFAANAVSTSTGGNSSEADAKVRSIVDVYEKKLIEAINGNNFSIIEPVLTPGSALYKAQQALVENLNKQGIKEELVSYEITDIKAGDKPNEYKVTAKEKTTIKSSESSQTKDFLWVYTIVSSDKGFTLSEINKP